MRVRVPATTANVGTGFDCIGIALDWYDELELHAGEGPLRVEVEGEGAGQVPLDESHLVVATMRRGLDEWGDGRLPGGVLRCHNSIPHARGLGSSAAAIVAGLALAWTLARDEELDRAEVARLACLLEGHADNAAAAVVGGATLGWIEGGEVLVEPLALDDRLTAKVWVPQFEVPTSSARGVLPDDVPRLDAVAQSAAAGRLVLALERRPDLLLGATDDRLHQRQRAALMPSTIALMDRLRAVGVPATVSGAGPTVFAIGTGEQLAATEDVVGEGFVAHALPIGSGVVVER